MNGARCEMIRIWILCKSFAENLWSGEEFENSGCAVESFLLREWESE